MIHVSDIWSCCVGYLVGGGGKPTKEQAVVSPQPSALSQLCPQGPSPQSALWPWRQPFVYLGSRFLRIIFPNIFGGKENQPAPSQTSPLGWSPHWGLPNHPQPLAQGLDSDNLMLTLFIVNLWSILHVCALVDSWWSAQPQPVVLSTLRRGLTIYCFSAMVMVMVIMGIQIYWSKKFSYLDTRSQEIFYNPYDCWTHKKGLLSCNR